jgi:hypothetical protein
MLIRGRIPICNYTERPEVSPWRRSACIVKLKDQATSTVQSLRDNAHSPLSPTPEIIVNPFAPLPDKLILEICDSILLNEHYWSVDYYSDATVAKKAFAALALTCRYLRPFAIRYLYSIAHMLHKLASLRRPCWRSSIPSQH